MRGTLRHILASAIAVDWSQFEGIAALRCTIGVAVPLVVGLAIHQPFIGAFGAIGAVSVGFGSFQGAYRSRAAVMLLAAAGMSLSVLVGSVAGHSSATAILVSALWGFGGGLLVALGPTASFVGLQSIVAVLVAGGYPSDLPNAAARAALVFAGGLVQTLLVVMIWPLQRFSAERRSLAAAFRSLAQYASSIPGAHPAAPEPHTFAGTQSPLADPQPFAKMGDVLVFQALLDEAERVRASLASLATQRRRLNDADQTYADALSGLVAGALAEIATALEDGREPREPPELWRSLDECARALSAVTAVDSLLGQIRAAWRTAGALTAAPDDPAPRQSRVAPLRRRPPIADALTTLRANLTLDSTACRHALRLAVTLAIATAIYRLMSLPRAYWIPMTAVLVLRPEFHDTFARGVSRIAGTILGAACATLIAHAFAVGQAGLTLLVLGFVWGGYAFVRASYAIFTVCITGYVVFLMMLAGVPEITAATDRVLYTMAGGVLALCVYSVWPTWAASEVRPAFGALLEAHSGYVAVLLKEYGNPRRTDLRALGEIRHGARLIRSNTEAVVERMLAEPAGRQAMQSAIALGLLAAIRRHALAALALHAGLERGIPAAVPGIDVLAEQMTMSLRLLADAVKSGDSFPPLPDLRHTQLALNSATSDLVRDETDLMVDSVDTMAELLARDVKERG